MIPTKKTNTKDWLESCAVPRPAPQHVFHHLESRRSRARFMVPGQGQFSPLTWDEYARAILEVAQFLDSVGLEAGQRVALFSANRVEWIEAALGAQAAGGVVVPIYSSSTADQAAYVIEHSDAEILFIEGENELLPLFGRWSRLSRVKSIVCLEDGTRIDRAIEAAQKKGTPVPPLADLEQKVIGWSRARAAGARREVERPGSFERRLASLTLEQDALMIYTSGTTGNPKGVPLSHRNLATNTEDWMAALAPLLKEGRVDLLWLPLSHIFGYGEVCIGNQLGWTSYLAAPKDVLDQLPRVRPQVFMSVPAYWEKLAAKVSIELEPVARRNKLIEATGGELELCLSGGAGLKPAVKNQFLDANMLILEGYGLTETAPTLTLNRPDDFRFDSVGKPIRRVELRLEPDGEILARGPSVFRGYHKDVPATRSAFSEDGWFRTGDIGRFTEDGFLQIVDRKKEILVTAGGKNIAPANIELRFRDDPLIANLVVFGDGKNYLVAGLWLNDEAVSQELAARDGRPRNDASPVRKPPELEQVIRDLLQERIDRVNAELAGYERIKRFAVMGDALTVEGGYLTPTLKLRRKKVYEVFGPRLEELYP